MTNKIKVGVMSDIHHEFDWPNTNLDMLDMFDVVLLAGDVWTGAKTAGYVNNLAECVSAPVLWIAGNHEFYGKKIEKTIKAFREHDSDNTHFLENDVWAGEVRGRKIRVLGCTLWTDYELYGTQKQSKDIAGHSLNDHRLITEDIDAPARYTKFSPMHAQRRHLISRMWLRDELSKPFDGVTVVMTHHAPHKKSVEAVFMNDSLTPAFCSDLSELIGEHDIDLWVHGHMHTSKDYVVEGTRVVCNPRGYFGKALNPSFDPALIVEV